MLIRVKLKGWLAGRLPGGVTTVEVPPGTTAQGVLDTLHRPVGPCIYAVDGEMVGYDTVLHEGEELEVAMMASGG
jgi:sulfur carrier protein ThiS